jgi:hypothetical protein
VYPCFSGDDYAVVVRQCWDLEECVDGGKKMLMDDDLQIFNFGRSEDFADSVEVFGALILGFIKGILVDDKKLQVKSAHMVNDRQNRIFYHLLDLGPQQNIELLNPIARDLGCVQSKLLGQLLDLNLQVLKP